MIGFFIYLIVGAAIGLTVGIIEGLRKQNKDSSNNDFSSHGRSYSYESKNAPKKKHSGRCDGDCANCPPHYGYRHGRWYYGHSHSEGCVFGGNKCNGGRD